MSGRLHARMHQSKSPVHYECIGYASVAPDRARVATRLSPAFCGGASLNLVRCQVLVSCGGCLGAVKEVEAKTHNEPRRASLPPQAHRPAFGYPREVGCRDVGFVSRHCGTNLARSPFAAQQRRGQCNSLQASSIQPEVAPRGVSDPSERARGQIFGSQVVA